MNNANAAGDCLVVETILVKIADVHDRVRMMDSLKLKKAHLAAVADAMGLDATGTRSAIAYRIARTA